MNLLFPLKQAFTTPIGDLLIFLTIAFVAVLLLYFYFWFRFGRQKDLTLCHELLFKKTEKKLKDITFRGFSKSDFFGKKQVVSLPDGRYGQCLIFYPELYSPMVKKRFEEYHMLLQKEGGTLFPNNIIRFENGQLVQIETQFMKSNGQSLINFAHYSLDKTLSVAEKELFLIDIAYMLEALHAQKTESGEALYHGFLIPSSFYLTLNLVKKITHIYLAEHGCAFALKDSVFQDWVLSLAQGKYILDPFVKTQVEKYQFIFSPEQKSKGESITKSSDYYSFGALSVFLFTQKEFSKAEEIDWKKIPENWREFLKECLNEQPEKRPNSFLELKEYFQSPEVEIAVSKEEPVLSNEEIKDYKEESIKEYFEEIHKIKQDYPFFDQSWHEGFVAIKESNWDKALDIFEKMSKSESEPFNAQLGLAILYYQKGDQDKAKKHYQEAKKIDADKISCFHKLIGFDI